MKEGVRAEIAADCHNCRIHLREAGHRLLDEEPAEGIALSGTAVHYRDLGQSWFFAPFAIDGQQTYLVG